MNLKQLAKLILVAVMVFSFSYKANSQVLISLLLGDKLNTEKLKFGLDGGANFASIMNIDHAKYQAHFNLGFYFDFLLKEKTHWYLHTGVLVKSTMGAQKLNVYTIGNPELDSLFVGGNIERRLSYFNVPILIRYKFKNEIFIEAGPNLGLLYKAYDEFYNEINEKQDLLYKLKVLDQYHRIDAGVEAGIGYHIIKGTGYNLGFRYYYGITGLLKDNKGMDPMHNSSFYLYASIPVGAGEKAKAKAEAKEKEKAAKKAKKESGK